MKKYEELTPEVGSDSMREDCLTSSTPSIEFFKVIPNVHFVYDVEIDRPLTLNPSETFHWLQG
jgi:hypothetical protein